MRIFISREFATHHFLITIFLLLNYSISYSQVTPQQTKFYSISNIGTESSKLISIDQFTAKSELVKDMEIPNLQGLAVNSKGEIFAIDGILGTLFQIDGNNGDTTRLFEETIPNVKSMSFASTDWLYVIDDQGDLYKINMVSGKDTLVGFTGDYFSGLAFDPFRGELFASGGEQAFEVDAIAKIDTNTASSILIGHTELKNGIPDIAFDQSGRLYGIRGGEDSSNYFFEIDKLTGTVTVIGDSLEFRGLSALAVTFINISSEEPQIYVDPPFLTFGDAFLSNTITQTITIFNIGEVNLNITAIEIVGTDADDFKIQSGGSLGAIYPNYPRTMYVQFTPSKLDSSFAQIKIVSDDPDEGEIYIPLTGNGISIPQPDLVVVPDTVKFEDVLVGSVKSLKFYMINSGDANLEISSLRIGGTNYSEFFFSDFYPTTINKTLINQPYTIAPGDSQEIVILCMPKIIGEKKAVVTISSNDPDENPYDLPLLANAFGIPDISSTPPSHNFGNVEPGNTADNTFTIKSEGSTNLNISSITITGNDAAEFTIISGGDPRTLNPGQYVNVVVRFTPTSNLSKYAYLTIASNDPDENPLTVELSGNLGVIPPKIFVVQPYYNAAVSMLIQWTVVDNAQEYQFRRKVDNSNYGEWQSVALETSFEDNSITVGPTFSYQVRVMVENTWSDSSRHRSSSATKIWPVTENSSCTSPVSHDVLNCFQQPIYAGGDRYLHEGLDLQGDNNVQEECIRAPLGGIITYIGGTGSNIAVIMRIRFSGGDREISFNHLLAGSINPNLTKDWSVAPGEPLGKIGSDFFGNSMNNHTHFHFNDPSIFAYDPLRLFDKTENVDPYGNVPVIENTNADGEPIKFRVGPREVKYFKDNGIVFRGVDIVVDATDHQSKDAPWAIPASIGYYIQRIKDGVATDIVRTVDQPYILMNSNIWYGHPPYHTYDQILYALLDVEVPMRGVPPTTPAQYGWPQWSSFIVTNTIGVSGDYADLDWNQCWATNAKNTEVAPNGYRSYYSVANVIEEAKFPDGFYNVCIRFGDRIHQATDYKKKIKVDNFRPYVKKCLVESDGSSIYFAKWDWDGSYLSLDPEKPKDGITGTAKVDRDVKIVITTSEPMEELYIENILPLGCGIINKPDNVNSDSTEWIFVVEESKIPDDGSKNGKNIIHIRGKDKAGTPLLGYDENITRYYGRDIPKRQADGTWAPSPPLGADRMHRFVIGMVDVAFVIDDTGSMGEEIAGVRQALLNHLATYGDDGKTTFLLATFKDGVSVREPTSELSTIQSQVSELSASGGGDCPEGSVEAINAIRNLMNDNGRVFLATDAAPHPGVDNSATIAALSARGVRVDIILSGDCNSLEKILSQVEGSADLSTIKENRKKTNIIENRDYISKTLTDTLNLMDEDFRGLPLPFNFPFSDKEYDSVFVGSNGYITFEYGTSTNYAYYYTLLSGPPMLAGFFADLDPQNGGKISYGLVGDAFYIVYDTVKWRWSDDKISFSIVLRPDGTFAFVYGELQYQKGLVGFSIGNNILDPGGMDLSEAEQPIVAYDYGTAYEAFTYTTDLSNTSLEFDRVKYVKPPVLNAVQAFSLMAKETGGIFAYVPEVNYYSAEDKQRFENIIFNLVQGALKQSLVFVEPNQIPLGSNLTISITGSGTNFQNTTKLDFSGSGITVNRINIVSSIKLEVDLSIDETTELGFKDIVAITSLGSGIIDTAKGVGAFEVIEQPYYPTIVGITPSSGQPGQTLTALIYGIKTNFVDSSEVYLGSGITINSVKLISPTILQSEISIASNAAVGFRDLEVNSGSERARENITGPFFVSMVAFEKPELVSVSPSFAAPGADITLNIKGNNTHFMDGLSIVTFSGTGIKLLNVAVVDSTELNADIQIDDEAAPGFRDVRISTNTESAVFLSGLLITTNKPTIQITSALFQNPASTKYCDLVVVTDQILTISPEVKVSVLDDSTDIPMTLIEGSENVYKGSYEFSNSGEHWITTSVKTKEGIDTVHTRNIEVLLAKRGLDYFLMSPDKQANLKIHNNIIQNETYFVADEEVDGDEKIYQYGPFLEFDKIFELEVCYDKNKYPNPEKLFISKYNGENWINIPSRVYPERNTIVANVNKLGKFKVLVDSTYDGDNTVPSQLTLKQCYPNPFNPSTTIEYNLPDDIFVTLTIYDAIGQKIKKLDSGMKSAGRYKITWNAETIASGIYYYQLRAGKFLETKKMILLR